MATNLSSNWKKLQAKIKAESGPAPSTQKPKRKADEQDAQDAPRKKQKSQDQKQKQDTRQKREQRPKATAKPKPKPMGNTQSSKIDATPKAGVAPSLALWAADNDISSEAIAEAYGLGLQSNALLKSSTSTPNSGLTPDIEVGKYISIDCEMVGVGEGGFTDELARASVVDFHGRQVYDSFVRPREKVVDWRTHVSGVSPRNMATAREFTEVQADIAELMRGRIIIGHDVKHDLRALEMDHPAKNLRDTAKFSGFKKYGHGPKPALRVLAKELLGVEIQGGQHSSIEDARVAMLLFRKHKPAFDTEHSNRYPDEMRPKKPKGKKTKKR